MNVVIVDYGDSPEEGPTCRPKIISNHILKIALVYANINPLETNVCLVRFGRRVGKNRTVSVASSECERRWWEQEGRRGGGSEHEPISFREVVS